MTLRGKLPRPVLERFAEKVRIVETGCLIWNGQRNRDGYGVFRLGSMRDGSRRKLLAHRFSYEWAKGIIPFSHHLDHLCRIYVCVNPDHLEPVTNSEHQRRRTAAPRYPEPSAMTEMLMAEIRTVRTRPLILALVIPTTKRCSESCEKPRVARGWCTGHYQKARKAGRLPPRPTMVERFWLKVDRNGPVPALCPERGRCWLWHGAITPNGYGQFISNTGERQAHRLAYLFVKGLLPPRPLELDHVCRVRSCVNPEHLEPVTRSENMLRSHAFKRAMAVAP